jgi:hypothetical protein
VSRRSLPDAILLRLHRRSLRSGPYSLDCRQEVFSETGRGKIVKKAWCPSWECGKGEGGVGHQNVAYIPTTHIYQVNALNMYSVYHSIETPGWEKGKEDSGDEGDRAPRSSHRPLVEEVSEAHADEDEEEKRSLATLAFTTPLPRTHQGNLAPKDGGGKVGERAKGTGT